MLKRMSRPTSSQAARAPRKAASNPGTGSWEATATVSGTPRGSGQCRTTESVSTKSESKYVYAAARARRDLPWARARRSMAGVRLPVMAGVAPAVAAVESEGSGDTARGPPAFGRAGVTARALATGGLAGRRSRPSTSSETSSARATRRTRVIGNWVNYVHDPCRVDGRPGQLADGRGAAY